MENFKLKLAKLIVEVSCLYSETKQFCKDFLSDGEPDIRVLITPEHNLFEQKSNTENVSLKYSESLAVYRQIAEKLPLFGSTVFHGAAISYKEKCFLFTAPSGTGKSTHIRLWRKYIGSEVGIINGDKPILKCESDGITVYGTPWCGKESWGKNTSAPLAAICIITRSKENEIKRLSSSEALSLIMKQTYLPKETESLSQTLGLIDTLLKKVPVFLLGCDISEQAVKTSFEAMTNESYK